MRAFQRLKAVNKPRTRMALNFSTGTDQHHDVEVNQTNGYITFKPINGHAVHDATVIFSHGLGDTASGWASGVWMIASMQKLDHVKFILPSASPKWRKLTWPSVKT